MEYSLEKIYDLVGKYDRVAGITFKNDSNSFRKYGDFVTVLFIYTQEEREELDEFVRTKQNSKSGFLKVKVVDFDFPKELTKELNESGINSEDIDNILFSSNMDTNTFHSTIKREITKITVPIRSMTPNECVRFVYGAKKMFIQSGVVFNPQEMDVYLAHKLFLEPHKLDEIEYAMIFEESNQMREQVEFELLSIKKKLEDISEVESVRLDEMREVKLALAKKKLNNYLIEAGSSWKLLFENERELAIILLKKVLHFIYITFSSKIDIPIYIDTDSYLHIYTRHVKEMKLTNHFDHKSNFQWDESDVFMVMRKVVSEIEDEYQHWIVNTRGKKFSKYGNESIYYQGDYYTIHIERSGRIETFHKNDKKAE